MKAMVAAHSEAQEAEFRRLSALYRFVESSSRAGAIEQVYEAALSGLLESSSADRAAILLLDEGGVLRFKASRGLSAEYLSGEYQAALTGHSPRLEAFTKWSRGTRDARPIVIADALNDPRLAAYRAIFQREAIRALVFLPLELEGGLIGKVMLYFSEPHECAVEELKPVQTLAAQLSAVIQRKQLEIDSRRLAAIVESSDDAIVSKNLNGIVTSWNQGAERIFGYTAEEMIGHPISVIAAPDRLDEMPEILAKVRRGERVDHYDTRRRRKDGEVIDVSLTVSPVRDATGAIVGASKIARDISGRKQAERERVVLFEQSQRAQKELERTNEDLRRANRALEAFAYSASHDLKEPLRTIAISAQLIERSGAVRGEDAKYLSGIFNAAKRMDILIRDVLAYTQITKKEAGPAPVVDSARVLAAVLQSLHGFTEEADAIVTSGSLPTVAMHENQLARLFQNLIDNAIKYRGKEAPRVHITAQERDGWCVFSVADNGIGIEPQYAERIFELFKRLHTRDQYPGSGLGLAICQRVVEQVGGRIWLEQSTPGRGSTFCFAIPASNT
jgi:PAS domain S-box-containing protein